MQIETLIHMINDFRGPLSVQSQDGNHIEVLASVGVIEMTLLPTGRVRDHFEGDTIIHDDVDAAFASLTA